MSRLLCYRRGWQQTALRRIVPILATTLLVACANRPPVELPLQRFDGAMRSAAGKLAAGELLQAAAAYAQAERIAALYDRRDLRVRALLAVGAMAALQEDDASAQKAYAEALSEAQALPDAHSASIARAGLADVQRRNGALDRARQNYALALEGTALQPGSIEQLQARVGQALVWRAQGQTTEARNALDTLEVEARVATSPVLPAVLVNQAVMLLDAQQWSAAMAKVQEALALDRAASNPMALAADLELLGRLYLASGDRATAQTQWERALRITRSSGQGRATERLTALLKNLEQSVSSRQ